MTMEFQHCWHKCNVCVCKTSHSAKLPPANNRANGGNGLWKGHSHWWNSTTRGPTTAITALSDLSTGHSPPACAFSDCHSVFPAWEPSSPFLSRMYLLTWIHFQYRPDSWKFKTRPEDLTQHLAFFLFSLLTSLQPTRGLLSSGKVVHSASPGNWRLWKCNSCWNKATSHHLPQRKTLWQDFMLLRSSHTDQALSLVVRKLKGCCREETALGVYPPPVTDPNHGSELR